MSNITLSLMSDDRMLEISSGEVTNYGHYNFRYASPQAIPGGLFCDAIFGPHVSYRCKCNKYRRTMEGEHEVCKDCGVPFINSKSRAERFGHINIGTYYVNPLMVHEIGRVLGIGGKFLGAISIGQEVAKIIPDQAAGALYTTEGDRYSIVPSDDGTITSVHGLVTHMNELGIDYDITMMESKSPMGMAYYEKGWSLLDLLNTKILVLPPDHRRLATSGDRAVYHPFNSIYTRMIRSAIRHNSFEKIREDNIATANDIDSLQSYESNIVQKLVNMLYLEGGSYGAAEVPPIFESLKGKGGRFRGSLLGKRVDFSGRSVVTTDPSMPIDHIGVPWKMMYELLRPHIIGRLYEHYESSSVKMYGTAESAYDSRSDVAMKIFEGLLEESRVLMNRAPSLHRYSVMAFRVKVHSGKSIKVPPLVLTPFNMDHDGDTVAIHLMLSDSSLDEYDLLSVPGNLQSSAEYDNPLLSPSHEMVVGAYLLSNSAGV